MDKQHWVATWGAAPAGPPLPAATTAFNDQTLRLIVHASIGGGQVRIRLSNEFGKTPLRIGAAHIALRQAGASIMPGTDRTLTFGGAKAIAIPARGHLLSDPVDLGVPALSDLTISLHLPGSVKATTVHELGFQTSYVSSHGNFAGAAALPVERTITTWPILAEVDVSSPSGGAIVALGDSITDGPMGTIDSNRRWPDLLALRLQGAAGQPAATDGKGRAVAFDLGGADSHLGVVNRGMSGNRLLRDPGEQPLFGKAAVARFERDVAGTAGVKHVIVFIGINDIGHPGTGAIPNSEAPKAEDLIAGYRRLIARAHAKGIAAYGATLTPFEGTVFPGYYTPAKELVRQAVNKWIRNSGEFDAVLDFDGAIRDPSHPARMLPAYDRGDHLHPNERGMQALAEAIPLELFRGARTATTASARRTARAIR
ncbi:MAG: SGNH/GDSL hydrolase family protein [Massilia sp.]